MNRRKFLLGLGATTSVASSGFVLGTGAFSASRIDREANISVSNDAEALIGLVPNEDIAGVELVNNQLAIVLDDPGINVNSVYQFGAFVDNEDSMVDLDSAVGNKFAPVTYEEPFDPSDNFRSAFMVRNQTDTDLDLQLKVSITNDGSTNEPKYMFQSHNKKGDTQTIRPQGDNGIYPIETPLPSGEAIGVSFSVVATDSEVGDSLSGTISVDAGEVVDY